MELYVDMINFITHTYTSISQNKNLFMHTFLLQKRQVFIKLCFCFKFITISKVFTRPFFLFPTYFPFLIIARGSLKKKKKVKESFSFKRFLNKNEYSFMKQFKGPFSFGKLQVVPTSMKVSILPKSGFLIISLAKRGSL